MDNSRSEDEFIERFYDFVAYDSDEEHSSNESENKEGMQDLINWGQKLINARERTKHSEPIKSPTRCSPPLRKGYLNNSYFTVKTINKNSTITSAGQSSAIETNTEVKVSESKSSIGSSELKTPERKQYLSETNLRHSIGTTTRNRSSERPNYSRGYNSLISSKDSDDTPNSKRFKSNLNTSMRSPYSIYLPEETDFSSKPIYKDHQLIGDSQFVRFASQIMPGKYQLTQLNGYRGIGYCVSGQKIQHLHQRLQDKNFNINDKVILMIGTNDLCYGSKLRYMCKGYQAILNILKNEAKTIVLLTIPPIPRLDSSEEHWDTLEKFNNFIMKQANNKNIFAVDFASLFITYNNKTSDQYFERVFNNGNKEDKLHLNIKGFKLLTSILNISYFNEY